MADISYLLDLISPYSYSPSLFLILVFSDEVTISNQKSAEPFTNLPDGIHACRFCPKTFTRKEGCEKHELLHQDRPYTCSICFEMFRLETALSLHTMYCIHGAKKSKLSQLKVNIIFLQAS